MPFVISMKGKRNCTYTLNENRNKHFIENYVCAITCYCLCVRNKHTHHNMMLSRAHLNRERVNDERTISEDKKEKRTSLFT